MELFHFHLSLRTGSGENRQKAIFIIADVMKSIWRRMAVLAADRRGWEDAISLLTFPLRHPALEIIGRPLHVVVFVGPDLGPVWNFVKQ